MQETRSITWESSSMGTAQISRQGLYLCFFCRCRLPGNKICKLIADDGLIQCSLGIPVPVAQQFELKTRVPAKQLHMNALEIYLKPLDYCPGKRFVPVEAGCTFPCLKELPTARAECRGSRMGIVLP